MKYLGQPQSGSQANITASHNRAGQYLRSRRTPVTPTRTAKQGILRGKFGAASAAWQSMTTALQSAWTAFAAAYPVVDSLGQSVTLTGQQYFIGLQTSLMNAGQPINTDIPTNTETPPIDTPVIYADDTGTVIGGVGSVTPGDFNLLAISKILSNGVNFNKAFSQFAILVEDGEVTDLSDAYANQFGAPVTGRKLFARFKEVNSSGMSGPDLIVQTPVITSQVLTAPVITNVTSGTIVSTAVGSGTAVQVVFQETGTPGVFARFNQSSGVAGVVTVEGVPPGRKTFTRLKIGAEWGPRSNIIVTH